MIPSQLLSKLESLKPTSQQTAERHLAELAGRVEVADAIVIVGSHNASIACWLGAGSQHGKCASVFVVSNWERDNTESKAAEDEFPQWQQQIEQLRLSNLVVPIRCDPTVMAEVFGLTIGLLVIDGTRPSSWLERNVRNWAPSVSADGLVIFLTGGQPQNVQRAKAIVDRLAGDHTQWKLEETNGQAVSARRMPESQSNGDRLTFVSNEELRRQLERRPAQYALDLSLIVSHRDAHGIFVDTYSPHHRKLVAKYKNTNVASDLAARIESTCAACPVGASCKFARLTESERVEIIQSKDRERWTQWCETNSWGGEVDLVYPYVDEPARGGELRYSIRSVEQNFVGTPRIWVIGDIPSWYRGRHIRHKRLSDRPHRQRFDIAAKLKLALRHREIGREFVLMMDDIYFVKPVTLEDFRRRWRRREMTPDRLERFRLNNTWDAEKYATWRALLKAKRPVDDLASHVPFVYEKDKLRKLFKKYALGKNPYVNDLLYLNEYPTQIPRNLDEILYREVKQVSAHQIRQRAGTRMLLNHGDTAYTPEMESVLQELFPDPSSCER